MKIAIDQWLSAAFEYNQTNFNQLIDMLPATVKLDQSSQLDAFVFDSTRFDNRVNILIRLSQKAFENGDPELVIDLATVGMHFCQQSYEQSNKHSESLETYIFGVSQFGHFLFRCYELLGHYSDMLTISQNIIQWLLEKKAKEEYIVDCRFYRISALIYNNRLEEAHKRLKIEEASHHTNHVSYATLKRQLNKLLQSSTEIKNEYSDAEEVNEFQEHVMSDIQNYLSQAETKKFKDIVQDFFSDSFKDQKPIESDENAQLVLDEVYQNIAPKLSHVNKGLANQFEVSQFIGELTKFLKDPKRGYDPEQLIAYSEKIERIRNELTDADTAEVLLWLLYLCYKRLGKFDDALYQLNQLRKIINQQRKKINDPLKRAGITSKFPNLYKALASILIKKDNARLLSMIEEAKARALSDKLAIETGQENMLDTSDLTENWLPDLMKQLNAHYITYLLDDDTAYAVCVTRQGSLHSAVLPISRQLLSDLRMDLNPYRWGKIIYRAPDDVAQQLSPLVNWLDELVEQDVLSKNDHICYSPDGLLHLVPLHYVDFKGEPLVKLFSLSRTHSASLLKHFADNKASKPKRYLCVKVPMADEVKNEPDKITYLSIVSKWLQHSNFPGKLLENEKANMDNLKLERLENAIIHFSTHGTFPKNVKEKNPYMNSGLILSKDGHLPDDNSKDILSPKCMLEQKQDFNFNHSHVTLQACVSGLSEEGAAGDALGPEWSFLMAGASSILSAHWDVPVKESAEFCVVFYKDWLQNGKTRAQAWRSAVISQMDEINFFNGMNALHWAAFSLAGDWR